ncbi:hypothetical protein BEN47_15510 [Hymenobacter lapidarius]|uniref:Integrase n=1 Tax=Hymenobacter lapidarius TaxID=1908237 RepID=A0A1G1T266_9BACT|nr:site-specific integrase [Hymenobacter lapidarius]OGX84964.1 hypothetical protein BEN47_15510 [Hymenobacter lapidarius]
MTLQERFPTLFNQPYSGEWLTEQEERFTPNTVSTYGYALVDYFQFCSIQAINPPDAERVNIVAYLKDLNTRSKSAVHASPAKLPKYAKSTTHEGFANATVRLRIATVRLYYDYLKHEGVRAKNPVRKGEYTKGRGYGRGSRGLVARYEKDPWLPNQTQWQAIMNAAASEPIRNRFMLALAYDAGLRRGELCALETRDFDPCVPLVRLRRETTKTGRAREVPCSKVTAELYKDYLEQRRSLSPTTDLLFLSESRRNKAQPLTFWTWSKIVQALGKRAGLPLLTTHTLRHLRLTDLARAGWKLPQIAAFAGHSSDATTMLYIHLSGHELSERFRQTLGSMLDWRLETMKNALIQPKI